MTHRNSPHPHVPTPTRAANPDSHQLAGCLARLVWMFVGNLVLAGGTAAVVFAPGGTALSVADLVVVVAAAMLAAVRYVDIVHLAGKTGEGEPATLQDWRRYVMLLGAVSGGLWVGAHAIAWWMHR